MSGPHQISEIPASRATSPDSSDPLQPTVLARGLFSLHPASRPWAVSLGAGLLGALLWSAAFPPIGAAALIFIFALPMLGVAAWRRDSPLPWRPYFGGCAVAGVLGWALTLLWLRHVAAPLGWLGVGLLALLVGGMMAGWLAVAGILFRRQLVQPTAWPRRLLTWAGLAGLWVLLEWVRTWLLTGFPWAPAAAALWKAPALLQSAAWLGQGAVSFAVIWANLALAHALTRLPAALRDPHGSLRPLHLTAIIRPTPELACLLVWVAVSLAQFSGSWRSSQRAEPLLTAAVIQPWTPAHLKWEPSRAQETLRELAELSVAAIEAHPEAELILWPEAATPYQLTAAPTDGLRQWLADLMAEVNRPILHGNLLASPDRTSWVNGLFLVETTGYVLPTHYAKRQLVPFGEYVPLRGLLGGLGKVVPLPADTTPGQTAVLIPLNLPARNPPFPATPAILPLPPRAVELPSGTENPSNTEDPSRTDDPSATGSPLAAGDPSRTEDPSTAGWVFHFEAAAPRTLQVGALICYEDIFPSVGYASSQGADLLVVITNDAWYGTGGGAYQHATHSVLRAVENRKPLLRAGNHGWSGWIDEWGRIRGVLTDDQGSIYTQGFAAFSVSRDPHFAGQDRPAWPAHAFTALCGLLSYLALKPLILRKKKPRAQN